MFLRRCKYNPNYLFCQIFQQIFSLALLNCFLDIYFYCLIFKKGLLIFKLVEFIGNNFLSIMKKYKMVLRWIFWILMIILVCCVAFYRCYFLRQPYRKVPNNENLFVSPANGKIIAIIKNPTDHTVIYKDNNAVLDHFID